MTEEIRLLKDIDMKLELLILVTSLQGKEEKEKIKILKSFAKKSNISKREMETIIGVDRHKF